MKHKNLRVDKEFVSKKNTEFLELIKKEVPKYDWEQQRIEIKSMYWENKLNTSKHHSDDIKYFYKTSHNGATGWIKIECRWDEDDVKIEIGNISMNFNDTIYGKDNWREVRTTKRCKPDGSPMESYMGGICKDVKTTKKERWDEVRLYFNTYLIPLKERIEKKIRTPRVDSISYYLNYSNQYEYDMIMMDFLYGDDIEFTNEDGYQYPNSHKKWFMDVYEDFQKTYKEKYSDGGNGRYFNSPINMIHSFMIDKGQYEMEYWLDEKEKEFESELEVN